MLIGIGADDGDRSRSNRRVMLARPFDVGHDGQFSVHVFSYGKVNAGMSQHRRTPAF
jgi:hypothetical protein